ncbi:hypothetical protein VNO80_19468 [Phaseolus coccineus]|uniref:Uncharacterized protein n=1 Tax=Phaseolus coccineus TaxID=3886 RepID=A0AAN9MGG8_PHACN
MSFKVPAIHVSSLYWRQSNLAVSSLLQMFLLPHFTTLPLQCQPSQSPEDLDNSELSDCKILEDIGVLFETLVLLKLKYRPNDLKAYIENTMLLTKAEMARRSRSAQVKPHVTPIVADFEKTTTMTLKRKRPSVSRPTIDHIDLEENSSHHQGSSAARSCKKGDNALTLQGQKSSWPEILFAFDHMDRDNALGKLQRTIEDYARHREECQATNRAWESTESILQDKILTLDTALEAAKDAISRSFVEGFSEAIEQFKVVQFDIDTSVFDPFKSVVDGKIMFPTYFVKLLEQFFNL